MTREVLFRASLGAVALHAIDDAFIQPQPGTSAADHPASGLVPIAFVAISIWAYPRVRDGTRAALCLGWAFAAILSGAEGIYYAGHGGLSGDDYTSLLALAAAPVLVGVGLTTLWQSRRLGDHPARRYGRRLLRTAGVVVVLMIAAIPLAVTYLESHVFRADVPSPELGAAYEDVSLDTSDGLKLKGWYVPSKNRAAVIVFPGRSGRGSRPACSPVTGTACCSMTGGARA